jgi:two-component system sensor histidine kinase VicK
LNEKQKKYLDEIYLSNQRMVELVNALLNVSNLELGTFPIAQEKTDICALTESVVSEQMPHIDAKKIGFYFRCDEAISFIQADPKLLRMIMQNILSNSIKYTPEHGKIDFSISLSNKRTVLIKISDTGYGIPKNQQDKIFTKLFRADNVKDKDTNGTGLGLYIVKSIVESSGGKIWFFSPKKSSISRKSKKYPGTTFYVTLPLNGIKRK